MDLIIIDHLLRLYLPMRDLPKIVYYSNWQRSFLTSNVEIATDTRTG
jgi:hypothetical protein